MALCSREVGGLEGRGNWKEAGRKVVGWISAPPQGWFEPPRSDGIVPEKDAARVVGVVGDVYIGSWVETGMKLAVLLVRAGRDAVATLGVKLGAAISPFGGARELENEAEASSGDSLASGALGLSPEVLSGGWSTRRSALM